jgi:hypothetical protein
LRSPNHCLRLIVVLRLVTIPISFLQRASARPRRPVYQEDAHLPFHVLPVRRGWRRTVPMLVTPEGTLRESSDILHWADARSNADKTLFRRGNALRSSEGRRARRGARSRQPLWAYAQMPHKALVLRLTARAPRCRRA